MRSIWIYVYIFFFRAIYKYPYTTHVMWLAFKEPTNARATFHVQEAARYKFVETVCKENSLVSASRFSSILRKLNARNSNHFRVSVFLDLESFADEKGHTVVAKMDSGWYKQKALAMAEIHRRMKAKEKGFLIEDHAHAPGCAEYIIKQESKARNYLDKYSKECFYVAVNREPGGRPEVAAKAIKKCRAQRPPLEFNRDKEFKDAYVWEYHLRKLNSKQNCIAGIVLKLSKEHSVESVQSELRRMMTANGNGPKPTKTISDRYKAKYGKEEFVRAIQYYMEEPNCSFTSYKTADLFVVEFMAKI